MEPITEDNRDDATLLLLHAAIHFRNLANAFCMKENSAWQAVASQTEVTEIGFELAIQAWSDFLEVRDPAAGWNPLFAYRTLHELLREHFTEEWCENNVTIQSMQAVIPEIIRDRKKPFDDGYDLTSALYTHFLRKGGIQVESDGEDE